MSWKVVIVLVLAVSAVGMSVTDAQAQIAGWGWFGFSDVEGVIDTIKTPNPDTKPSTLLVSASATIQIACTNPADNGVFAGKSFTTTLEGVSALGGESSVVDVKSGKATTSVFLNLNEFDNTDGLHPEASRYCTNPNWAPKPESAMVLALNGIVYWYLTEECTIQEGQLVCSRKGLLDSEVLNCTLDTALYPRSADGTANHDAVLTCLPPGV
jgi:hypothetical protein